MTRNDEKGVLFVVSGPAGVGGRDTLRNGGKEGRMCFCLFQLLQGRRGIGEKDGVHYYYKQKSSLKK